MTHHKRDIQGQSSGSPMYLKSLVVFLLCTGFVLGFVVVLNYEAAVIGSSTHAAPGSQGSSCQTTVAGCELLHITSASLYEENYSSSLLGPGGYARLVLGLNLTGPSTVTGLKLFIDNTSAGVLQGPFEAGSTRVINVTLPATVSVSAGTTYQLRVEGLYGNNSAEWASIEVTAA